MQEEHGACRTRACAWPRARGTDNCSVTGSLMKRPVGSRWPQRKSELLFTARQPSGTRLQHDHSGLPELGSRCPHRVLGMSLAPRLVPATPALHITALSRPR